MASQPRESVVHIERRVVVEVVVDEAFQLQLAGRAASRSRRSSLITQMCAKRMSSRIFSGSTMLLRIHMPSIFAREKAGPAVDCDGVEIDVAADAAIAGVERIAARIDELGAGQVPVHADRGELKRRETVAREVVRPDLSPSTWLQ